MHDLFVEVLNKKDLSKAGNLFLLSDDDVAPSIIEVIQKINEIISQNNYIYSANDQSIVEICLTKITTCIRDLSIVEQTAHVLTQLLQSCLKYDLMPSCNDEDAPHAKIASEIISCIFLNCNKREVMKIVIPVVVKFLHKGNKDLNRNLTSYLALVAMDNAEIIAHSICSIIESVMNGNYGLVRLLPEVYSINQEPINRHVSELISLLPKCEITEKVALLTLFHYMSMIKPFILESSLSQLLDCLSYPSLALITLKILQNIVYLQPHMFFDQLERLKATVDTNEHCLVPTMQIIGIDKARYAIQYILEELHRVELSQMNLPLKQLVSLCEIYPSLLNEKLVNEVSKYQAKVSPTVQAFIQQLNNEYEAIRSPNHATGGITIIKVGPDSKLKVANQLKPNSRIGSTSYINHNMPSNKRINSAMGFHKSLPKISSNQASIHKSLSVLDSCSAFNMTSPNRSIYNLYDSSHSKKLLLPEESEASSNLSKVTSRGLFYAARSSNATDSALSSTLPLFRSHVNSIETGKRISTIEQPSYTFKSYNKTSVTVVTDSHHDYQEHHTNQRISVFEPLLIKDTIQSFCEKHLDKIKAYMQKVGVKVPLPVKCIIEERKNYKHAKLNFTCQARKEHCLYSKSFFSLKTRNPRLWARANLAFSSKDSCVTSLKHCWDTLQCDDNTFLTLVTSAFPSDQEILLLELRNVRFFDVFEYNGMNQLWGCFLCNHPDRAVGFINNREPVIEGELREKKGKWKFFKRWKTRYFTLSAGNLSYREYKKDMSFIEINEIKSIKTINKGVRNIPKAFEIFTDDRSFVLKPKNGKNTEEWVQYLSVALAHYQANEQKESKLLFQK